MKTISLFAVLASVVSAQVTILPNRTYSCAVANGAYCAGDSLVTNIIIRCTNGVGHPGNCNDNLAGEPPLGVSYAPCYQSSTSAGDAACSKNGIVYGANGPFPVPGGTVSSSSVASASATPSASANVTTASNTTGTTAGSGSTPKLTPTPSAYTGDASSVFALGDKSQSLGSALALLGLVAGMGWFL